MKLTKEHIVAIVVLVAVLGALGGVYQFYYKQRLDEYAKNITQLKNLEDALAKAKTDFALVEGGPSYIPDVLISAYTNEIQPLEEEVLRRGRFFSLDESLKVDPPPSGVFLSIYYKNEFNKLYNELRQDVMSRIPYWPYYPETNFGAPLPSDFEGSTPQVSEITQGLARVKFGCSLVRMLMDAKAVTISEIEIWPPYEGADKLLSMRTVGLAFMIKLEDLVTFLDKLRMSERYYSVDAISIQNRYLRWQPEPPVEVQMLLTQAEFVPPSAKPAAGPGEMVAGARGPGALMPGMSPSEMLRQGGFQPRSRGPGDAMSDRSRYIPKTKWQRFKRWFRKYFWPF